MSNRPEDFHASRESAVFWELFVTWKEMMVLQHDWASQLGVSEVHWLIVKRIRSLGRTTGKELALTLKVAPPFISSHVKTLEKLSWIRRTRSKQDGRLVFLSLTKTAIERMTVLNNGEVQLNESITTVFDDAELNSFLETCGKLRKTFMKASLISQIDSHD